MALVRPDLLFYCNYSLVLLRSFLFTLSVVLFARAPFSNWCCCAVRAAFIAKIQYCCDSTLDLLRSLKLIQVEIGFWLGHLPNLVLPATLVLELSLLPSSCRDSHFSCHGEKSCGLYPLGVCDVEHFGDKLFDPISTVEECWKNESARPSPLVQ